MFASYIRTPNNVQNEGMAGVWMASLGGKA